ncbi:MAG: FAD-binding dehydrogenase [Bacteroidia bacterium]
MTSDVIIIGGGLAGITAAIELLDRNLRVILLDRNGEDRLGGLAVWSLGGLFYVDSPFHRKAGIKDSTELALSDWLSASEFDDDDIWPRRWAEHYVSNCTQEVYEWLKPKGVKYVPSVQWVERGLFRPGNSVPRFHLVWGSGRGLVNHLTSHLSQHPNRKNLTLMFRSDVTKLLTHNGKVSGVVGKNLDNGQPFEIEASHVIAAAGGITGDVNVVRQHWYKPWGAPPEKMLSGSHLVANGDIHRHVQEAGAHVTHLDRQWNYAAGVHHPDADHPDHGLSIIPPKSALWLNYHGERMGPMPLVSGYDSRYLVERICQEPKKYSWQVMNRKIADKELAVSGSMYNDALTQQKKWAFAKNILFGNRELVDTMIARCKDFVVANTVEELAGKMNALTGEKDIHPEILRKTIEAYDATIDRGEKYFNDEQLRRIVHLRQYSGERLRTCKFQKIMDSGALPLIAVREFILARKTIGGIKTDLQCRVLTPDDQVVEGLYAIGEAAGFGGGGIHGLRALEGTFLGNCVFNGRAVVRGMV